MTGKLDVMITHPRTSHPLPAKVAPECPAKTVLQGLQMPNATEHGAFLDPEPEGRPYVLTLARTGQVLAPDTTMAQAGVRPHDTLSVEQIAAGAVPWHA